MNSVSNPNPRYRGYITSSAIGNKLRQIKAVRGLHKKLRAQGRVPGAEATAAHMRNAAARRAAKALIEEKGRSGSTLADGSY